MLAAAIAVGIAFSIGQEARGAHFLSHDLTSAAIVWFVQLGLYAGLFGARVLSLTSAQARALASRRALNAAIEELERVDVLRLCARDTPVRSPRPTG